MNKEEEITKRIEMLKRKNELLMQRHKEVEEDKKSAGKSGHSITTSGHSINSSYTPSTESPPRPSKKVTEKDGRNQSRAHMDDVEKIYEARNTDNRNNRQPMNRNSTGRDGNANRGVSRGRGRGRGGGISEYEEKRRENFRLMEEEIAQSPPAKVDDDTAPVVSRFLDDPRRRGELNPEQRWQSSRHKGSYGGLEFDNIKRGRGRGGQHHRENRGRGRGMSRLQMSAEYTGRERQDQERWLVMREAADREILARSKTSQGKWRREWDSQKDEDEANGYKRDTGQSERYDEPHRNHRGGNVGRGKRGSGRGRRGSRSSHESGDNGKDIQKQKETNDRPSEAEVHVKNVPVEAETTEEDKGEIAEIEKAEDKPAGAEVTSKPQRPKRTQTKSPRHLVQQRAHTPSSKDGTEVWAQNSHHSDETGQEWKNGANRSTEQWLPSDEGNRNPAIDERMLEQQEDGATVYSQQLGRGWGDDKNIKATKAWVIDTEKAGVVKKQPDENEPTDQRGRKGDRMSSIVNAGSNKQKNSRLKDVANERAEFRSASPRLKRNNPGLTVEIKTSGSRRVKRYSEGDSVRLPENNKANTTNTNLETEKGENLSPNSVKSPGDLKTPEGLKYVEDWALEMDIQSPSYESKQIQLGAVVPDDIAAKSASNNEEALPEENSSNDNIGKDLNSELVKGDDCNENSNENVETSELINENITSIDLKLEVTAPPSQEIKPETSPPGNEAKMNSDDHINTDSPSQEIKPETSPPDNEAKMNSDDHINTDPPSQEIKPETSPPDNEAKMNSDDHINTDAVDSHESENIEETTQPNAELTDSNFKDAEEDIDDEFYECGDDDNQNEADASVDASITKDVNGDFSECKQVQESTEIPTPIISSEILPPVLQETITIQQSPRITPTDVESTNEGEENLAVKDNCVNKNEDSAKEGEENLPLEDNCVKKNECDSTDSCTMSDSNKFDETHDNEAVGVE